MASKGQKFIGYTDEERSIVRKCRKTGTTFSIQKYKIYSGIFTIYYTLYTFGT